MGRGANHLGRLLVACALWPHTAHSANPLPLTWDLCPPMATPQRSFDPPENYPAMSTYVTADHIESRERRYYFLDGDAKILQQEQWIEAEHATYDQDTGDVAADGHVVFGEPSFSINGTSLRFNAEQYKGQVERATYFLPDVHVEGHAESVVFENEDLIRLNRASYSTCIGDDPDWSLSSRRVTLDRKSGFGSATNVVFRFYDVPVFYFPYINFPITADRKSGFMYPSVGYSDRDGTEIATPYYVNLAPNYDLTLTPRSLWRRGVLLDGEGRYLTRSSSGLINFGYLGNDKQYKEDRKSLAWAHQGSPAPNFALDVKANYVSDPDYLDDFGNSINATTADHLERTAALTHKLNRTTSTLRARAYQTIDPNIPVDSYPYRQLPQLLVSTSDSLMNRAIDFRFMGEFVNFDHQSLPTTRRVHVLPELRAPWRRPAGYVTPGLAVDYAGYDTADGTATSPTSINRTLPIVTLDSGVFLERDIRFEGTDFLQTLEPRLFYAYIPYEDQSDIPLFDSGATTFSYGQMFRPNRFSGADRVGDTNHVTAAVTTRLYDNATGYERFNFSIGQMFFFADRKVNLTGEVIATAPQSDIAAQSTLRLSKHVRLRGDSIYDPFAARFDHSGIRMQYKDTRQKLVNIGYRLSYGSTEQTDYSFAWPIGPQWWVTGRWLRDHALGRSLEIIEGLQYSSCCWNVRLLSRRNYEATNDVVESRLMVEFEFKGLASTGTSATAILDESIAGFAEPRN